MPIKNAAMLTTDLANREENDFYATDERAMKHLLDKCPEIINPNFKCLEPCAGVGNLSDEFTRLTNIPMDTYDLISRREDIIEGNIFEMDYKDKYDLILTNPPYLRETKNNPGLTTIIEKCLDEVKEGGYVCLFLKLLTLEGGDRFDRIYKERPPQKVLVFSNRIDCFKNNDRSYKQGAICYAWYVWHKVDGKFTGPTTIDWIRYKER